MTISTSLLGQKVFYTDTFFDRKGNQYPVCYFGKVDSVTVSATDETKYITVIDNKGRTTNFATEETIKTARLNALTINRLHLAAHERFMQSLYR